MWRATECASNHALFWSLPFVPYNMEVAGQQAPYWAKALVERKEEYYLFLTRSRATI